MRNHLLACGVVLLVPLALALPAAAQPGAVRAGHVTQVITQSTPTPGPGQSDVVVQAQVAASAARPGFAAAVTEEGLQTTSGGTFGVSVGLAVTRDGGRSWTSRVVPGITAAAGGDWLGVSWPTVAVAPDGTIYVVASVRSADPCHQGLGVTRSVDGGVTFEPLVLVQEHTACGELEGRSSLAVDAGPLSPHRGRLYLAWTSYRTDKHGAETGQVQTLSSSPPGGTDWSTPVDVTAGRQPDVRHHAAGRSGRSADRRVCRELRALSPGSPSRSATPTTAAARSVRRCGSRTGGSRPLAARTSAAARRPLQLIR